MFGPENANFVDLKRVVMRYHFGSDRRGNVGSTGVVRVRHPKGAQSGSNREGGSGGTKRRSARVSRSMCRQALTSNGPGGSSLLGESGVSWGCC